MAFDYWQDLIGGNLYHLYNRSIDEKELFQEPADYFRFLKQFGQYFSPYFTIWAYCLMPNHFHFLVEVNDTNKAVLDKLKKERTEAARSVLLGKGEFNHFLSDQFRRFFSGYTLSYNYRYGRKGALFQKRIKRVVVKTEVKIQNLICYIHHNPIHHGFARNYGEWPHCSYLPIRKGLPSFTNRNRVLQWLGSGDEQIGIELFFKVHEDFKIDPKLDLGLVFT